MKKNILLTICFSFCVISYAQNEKLAAGITKNTTRSGDTFSKVGKKPKNNYLSITPIFEEDFDNISGDTSGGPGTYAFPSGWTLFNLDSLIPETQVAYVNDAWVRREDAIFDEMDSCAFSNSWYKPEGKSDDWMISPMIGPITAGMVLKWNAVAYDANFADGYEVRIFTTTPVLDTLLDGSTVATSIAAELITWQSRFVKLDQYVGQNIYVAFRNNTNNKFLLLIDDIVVTELPQHDIKMSTIFQPFEYTMIPQFQVTPFALQGTILNEGADTITNVRLNVNIYDYASNMVYTDTSSVIAMLPSGDSTELSVPSFLPPELPNTYMVEYIALMDESEVAEDTVDNMLDYSVIISDSTYARDKGAATGSIGIGAGNGGYIGVKYSIDSLDQATTITIYYSKGYTGKKLAAAIWDVNGAGKPNTIIAKTDTLLYTSDSAGVYVLPIYGGYASLAPGNYVVTAIEFDSTLNVGNTLDIFIPGTCWVNWPTSPANGWANLELFGSNFAKVPMIQLNFSTDPQVSVSKTAFKDQLIIYPNPANTFIHLMVNQNAQAVIMDILGNEVLTTSLDRGMNNINIQHLTVGVYTIRLLNSDSSTGLKFIKQQ